jgi:hypothetical protein
MQLLFRKLKLAQKDGRSRIITIFQEQTQSVLAKFKTQEFWKVSNKATTVGQTASSCKGMTLNERV